VIWVAILLVVALAMTPLLLALRRPAAARGRRDADLALYRAQADELDREREAGRLSEAAHKAAMLEVQRRLLAAPEDVAARGSVRSLGLVGALVFLIPAAAVGFYLWRGSPQLPAATLEVRQQIQERDQGLIDTLRARIETLDPTSDTARQGFLLLGEVERNRGRVREAAEAFERALAVRFDADVAADVAELRLELNAPDAALPLIVRALAEKPGDPRIRFLAGLAETQAGRHANARRVWQALLADTPRDAPWRGMLELRLQELP
jgi:cytochrome c-type biogenesis protein CcmH